MCSFNSSINETTLPTIGLPTAEGYGRLWGKVRKALIYLYHNHLTFDWFLKADDDTYVVMDNLRRLLKQSTAVRNSDPAVWFGCRFKNPKIRQGYMSGGAGYVLSREALKRVVLQALVADSDRRICSDSEYGFEDLELGVVLFHHMSTRFNSDIVDQVAAWNELVSKLETVAMREDCQDFFHLLRGIYRDLKVTDKPIRITGTGTLSGGRINW